MNYTNSLAFHFTGFFKDIHNNKEVISFVRFEIIFSALIICFGDFIINHHEEHEEFFLFLRSFRAFVINFEPQKQAHSPQLAAGSFNTL